MMQLLHSSIPNPQNEYIKTRDVAEVTWFHYAPV